jgi:cytidine deaminase
MTNRENRFKKWLDTFPKHVKHILQTIPLQGGRLTAQQCRDLIKSLGIDLKDLMVLLLPLARIYAEVPLSRFQVGAVAMAGVPGVADQVDLFLGANLEFMRQDLNQTIHAEQSATMNAWHQGAHYLHAVAVSEAPCGHCRQFLYEIENSAEIEIITPGRKNNAYRQAPLSDLLPEAFGPADLGNRNALMARTTPDHRLRLKTGVEDRVIAEAVRAAEKSYAPYSRNFAGCALQTVAGEIDSGRNVESAAYNPSLTPLQSAIISLNMSTLEENHAIQRVVLVEKLTDVSQRKAVELLLGSWAPGVELEYYEVQEN